LSPGTVPRRSARRKIKIPARHPPRRAAAGQLCHGAHARQAIGKPASATAASAYEKPWVASLLAIGRRCHLCGPSALCEPHRRAQLWRAAHRTCAAARRSAATNRSCSALWSAAAEHSCAAQRGGAAERSCGGSCGALLSAAAERSC
jgi:hypothetical protein